MRIRIVEYILPVSVEQLRRMTETVGTIVSVYRALALKQHAWFNFFVWQRLSDINTYVFV
jgi:hypothetical protein